MFKDTRIADEIKKKDNVYKISMVDEVSKLSTVNTGNISNNDLNSNDLSTQNKLEEEDTFCNKTCAII